MALYQFKLPDIGEGLHEAEVVTWFVSEGDDVKENENIAELQTDKAVVEISAPVSGKIEALKVAEGESIEVGETLVVFSHVDEQSLQLVQKEHTGATAETTVTETTPTTNDLESELGTKRVLAAPSIRKAARDKGIDLKDVPASGKAGRVLRSDWVKYLENLSAPKLGPETPVTEMPFETRKDSREKIVGIRKAIFENMTQSYTKAVHTTGFEDVNVSSLVEIREKLNFVEGEDGISYTYLPFIIKAVSRALKKHRLFNTSIDEANMEIVYRGNIHIGVAMATEKGLVVPVIRHADQLSIRTIAIQLKELTEKARTNKLTVQEMTGSTFTISSTGPRGGIFATPIINYPEVAILGVHQIKRQPVIQGDDIVIGHVMGMSLTFDHRIIDGMPAGEFMYDVKQILETPELFIVDQV